MRAVIAITAAGDESEEACYRLKAAFAQMDKALEMDPRERRTT